PVVTQPASTVVPPKVPSRKARRPKPWLVLMSASESVALPAGLPGLAASDMGVSFYEMMNVSGDFAAIVLCGQELRGPGGLPGRQPCHWPVLPGGQRLGPRPKPA